jgi:hypothetical protein
MSDIKWQGSECTLGIVKSEGEKFLFSKSVIYRVFSVKCSGKQMFLSLINNINNQSTL